jgi:hypothetical protein
VQRFRGRVPHFWIYLVRYPHLVADPIRPAAIVMSDRVHLNPAIFQGMLLSALERLT